jgi:hypothetical protein
MIRPNSTNAEFALGGINHVALVWLRYGAHR